MSGRDLPPLMLRRIRARCIVRARGYKHGHKEFSEPYYCCGAAAVLSCFRDPAAKAFARELLDAAFFGPSIRDQSAAAQAKRAEWRAFFAKLDAGIPELNAMIEQIERRISESASAPDGKEQSP